VTFKPSSPSGGGELEVRGVGRYEVTEAGVVVGVVRKARVEVVLVEVAEVGISSTRSGVC
jgi:hypothetical protein